MRFLRRWLTKSPQLTGLKPGQAGEVWVAYLYQKKGYEVLFRNYELYGQKKLGEIDIVCRAANRLIMVEVKTRSSEEFMNLLETVNFRKQILLRRMAKLFVMHHPEYENYQVQIDVAAVLIDPFDNSIKSVKVIENAIEDSE